MLGVPHGLRPMLNWLVPEFLMIFQPRIDAVNILLHHIQTALGRNCNCQVRWTISSRDCDSLHQLRFSTLHLFFFPAVAADASSDLTLFMVCTSCVLVKALRLAICSNHKSFEYSLKNSERALNHNAALCFTHTSQRVELFCACFHKPGALHKISGNKVVKEADVLPLFCPCQQTGSCQMN